MKEPSPQLIQAILNEPNEHVQLTLIKKSYTTFSLAQCKELLAEWKAREAKPQDPEARIPAQFEQDFPFDEITVSLLKLYQEKGWKPQECLEDSGTLASTVFRIISALAGWGINPTRLFRHALERMAQAPLPCAMELDKTQYENSLMTDLLKVL